MVTCHCRDCGSKEISLCDLNPNEDGIEAIDLAGGFDDLGYTNVYCLDCGEENKCWDEKEVCK